MFLLRVVLKSGYVLEWPANRDQVIAFMEAALRWKGKRGLKGIGFADDGGILVDPAEIAAIQPVPQGGGSPPAEPGVPSMPEPPAPCTLAEMGIR